MTNPPNQGPSQWGSPGSQPSAQPPTDGPQQYGQPGQYGQQPPSGGPQQYGQQPPQYGGPQQYGQQPPQHGGPQQYGQQPPPYGQQPPGNGQPPYGGQTQFGGPPAPKKNNTPMLIGVGVIVLALIAGLIWFFTRGDEPAASTPAVTTSQQSTEPNSTEPNTTEPETTDPETTEPETTEPETTDVQTTQNTGNVPADPGKFTSVGSDSLTPPATFGDYSKMDPNSTATILLFYVHNSTPGKLVSVTVLPLGIDGTSARARLVNPQVVGDAVCGGNESGNSSTCVVDIANGYIQFTSSDDVNATGALFATWLAAAVA